MPLIDLNLLEAIESGDVDFLRRAVASNLPHDEDYFFRVGGYGSNILNYIAYAKQVDFLKVAMEILPTHILQKLLSARQHLYGYNPIHEATKTGNTEILRIMLGFYKQDPPPGPPLVPDDINHPLNKPWLALTTSRCRENDNNAAKSTPLHMAIRYGRDDESALEIMSMDMELLCSMLDEYGNSPLFLAVQKGFNRVAEKILNSDCSYSLNGRHGSTALHVAVAPKCLGKVIKLLLRKHLNFLDTIDCEGHNVLQKWAKERSFGQLELLLDEGDILADARSKVFYDLYCMNDVEDSDISPLHLALSIPNIKFVKALIGFYQQRQRGGEKLLSFESLDFPKLPWQTQSHNGNTLLHSVISLKLDEHAIYFLELDSTLCEIKNNMGESALFVAVREGCEPVVERILNLYPNSYFNMLRRNDGMTLLHFLNSCSEETGKRLLGKYWWMINVRDINGKTALDEARKGNVPWLVNLLINPSLIQKEPFDWIGACERDEISSVLEFIDTCNDLEEVCRKENDTPLHHIKLATYQAYRNLLRIPSIKELKNTTNREGETPLHRALKRKDIHLAQALLIDTEVERNIMDDNGNTALGLLVELCEEDGDWAKMCKLIKVNPYLKTTYIQSRTDLDQMRNTLSVVAALLATITFAAGFTLPGGLNSDTGYSMLAKNAPFLVFLLADAYAMCTSMLVLFCLIWSMISDRDMSYFLVDRSVLILMQSLYGTLLAFMTGIYVVIAHDSLWAAIIVLVFCSLIAISSNRTVLHVIISKIVPAVVTKLLPAAKKDDICLQLLEEGNPR